MANLNIFAHQDNPYKNGIGDLAGLAANDKEFGEVAKKNSETGAIISDWSDREYSKKLISAVLRRDFQLDLKYPNGSLAPALTNKMNYLLCIRDLALLNNYASEGLFGIDIGTGAAMYFAAIAVRFFKWKMLATEENQADYNLAIQNCVENKLTDDIKLVQPSSKSEIFCGIDDGNFFFSVCNPPFYEHNVERRSREEFEGSDAGRGHEIATDGGEVEFVNNMIDQSARVCDRVKIFSTLVGHKKNLSDLKKKIYSMPMIKSHNVFELCQGKTMRWVLAWTFDSEINLNLQTKKQEAKSLGKQKKPITFEYESSGESCLKVAERLKTFLSEIDVKVTKEGAKNSEKACYLRLVTHETNWRGLRTKRRALEKGPHSKRQRLNSDPDCMESETSAPVQLDCQLYLEQKEGKVTSQFIFLNGNVGKGGMAELVQCLKREVFVK